MPRSCHRIAGKPGGAEDAQTGERQRNVAGVVRSHVLAEIQARGKPVWGCWIYALTGGVFAALIAGCLN